VESKIACDIHDLLDEAQALLPSATLEVRPTATLIGKLRSCAEEARDIGFTDAEQRLRQAADDLEQRLIAP
jgi:hypothetical protein